MRPPAITPVPISREWTIRYVRQAGSHTHKFIIMSDITTLIIIHNSLVTDESIQFSRAYVDSTVGALEDHGATIASLDRHSFGIFYDRGVWSLRPRANETDVVMFMRVRATWCNVSANLKPSGQ